MKIEIAKRLYEYRRAAGLSQEQVAAKIDVSRQAVSKWECAEASPDTDNLIALALLYGITVDELLFADPEKAIGEAPVSKAAGVETAADNAAQSEPAEDAAEQGEDTVARSENATAQSEDDTVYPDEEWTAWQQPNNPENDYVRVSLGEGVHVLNSKKGEEVHVGWDGIHVDNDKEHVHIDFGNLAKMIREFRKDQR
ncbi:helix-turn-helix transcriptional regulator [Cryptobacterium curtum]|uniref:helix-turn-helix transcriptional regulator n=1 Tax=Cryptobacterium curtum TaxID=84163 RepID=UPI0028D67D05|nr:helix-turn-helix transcriptional regulator [Cryptobacterium curtum]